MPNYIFIAESFCFTTVTYQFKHSPLLHESELPTALLTRKSTFQGSDNLRIYLRMQLTVYKATTHDQYVITRLQVK